MKTTGQMSNPLATRRKKSPSSKARGKRAEDAAWLRATLRAGLERDTLLMPWVIADSVCGEVSRFLGVELPDRYVDWLDAKAERCYAGHRHFYKLMRGSGNAPRDWLYVFMRHWLDSMLKLERPDLRRCLPREFGNGHRLPDGTHPREDRRGFIRDLLPAPRPWDAARVTRHFRWSWLAGLENGNTQGTPRF